MNTNDSSWLDEENGYGMFFSCGIGAGVWMFLSCDPSPTAWIIAWLLLSYLLFAYCLLELYLMDETESGPIKVHAQQQPPLRLEI